MMLRREVTYSFAVLFNELTQAKFVHTVSVDYVMALVFCVGHVGVVLAARPSCEIGPPLAPNGCTVAHFPRVILVR